MTADEDQSRFDRSRFWTSAHEISIDVKAQHSVVEEWGRPEDKDTPSAWRDWVWRDETELAYGHEALRVLSAFFLFYPHPDGSKALEQNSGILPAIREQSPSSGAAVLIGAIILRHEIGTMDPETRMTTMKQLSEMSDQDWEQFREVVRTQFREVVRTGKGNISFTGRSVTVGTLMIAKSIAVAGDALERGKIDQKTFDAFRSEVFRALNDQSRQQ